MHVLQEAIDVGIASKCTNCKQMQIAQIQIAEQGEDGSEVQDEEKRPRILVVRIHQRRNL